MLVAWELETQVEPICGKVSPFFGHFDKRTLFSRWGIRRMQSRWVVCCSFLRLWLILFLADWTAHFGCGNSGTLHHVLFLSWYFLFNGTELLRWLLLRDQYITSAASVPLSQELRPGLGWDIHQVLTCSYRKHRDKRRSHLHHLPQAMIVSRLVPSLQQAPERQGCWDATTQWFLPVICCFTAS